MSFDQNDGTRWLAIDRFAGAIAARSPKSSIAWREPAQCRREGRPGRPRMEGCNRVKHRHLPTFLKGSSDGIIGPTLNRGVLTAGLVARSQCNLQVDPTQAGLKGNDQTLVIQRRYAGSASDDQRGGRNRR